MFHLPGESVQSNNAKINLYWPAGSYYTCTHLSLFCIRLVHVCQVFCCFYSMMSCIPCLVRVSSFIQLVLLLTYFEYITQFCLTSLVLNFFPTILSLISYSVSCKLFEPWMELNGIFYYFLWYMFFYSCMVISAFFFSSFRSSLTFWVYIWVTHIISRICMWGKCLLLVSFSARYVM